MKYLINIHKLWMMEEVISLIKLFFWNTNKFIVIFVTASFLFWELLLIFYFFLLEYQHLVRKGIQKIVFQNRERKNVGHHGWPAEEVLGFKWPKTAQVALKVLCFFRNIFNFLQDFSEFLRALFFLQVFFHKNPLN